MSVAVNTGIVGIGNIGSVHASQIFKNMVPGMKLAAICDIKPSIREWAAGEFPGVCIFEKYNDMLKMPGLDAVIIAVPHLLHPSMAISSFNRGLHVLTEKPAGVCVEHVRAMNEAAEKSGKIYAIMFNQRTDPLFTKAKEIIAEGKLGSLKRLVWNITNWYRTQSYYDSGGWRATWQGEGGGVLMNQAPHNLDIWQWLFGMPDRIKAFLGYGKYHNIEVEDDAVIYGEYSSGATAVFITSTGEYPGTNRLEISGDCGKIVLENNKLSFRRIAESERDLCFSEKQGFPEWETSLYEYSTERRNSGHLEILRNFSNAVNYGEKLIAPGQEGIKSLTLTNAAYLSDWKNDWVELPLDIDFEPYLRERCTIGIQKDVTADIKRDTGDYNGRWKVNW